MRSAGGRFTRYTTAEGLSHDRITALFEDRRGALWIGTLQGLTRLKDGAFTAYREQRWLHRKLGTGVSRGQRRHSLGRHL